MKPLFAICALACCAAFFLAAAPATPRATVAVTHVTVVNPGADDDSASRLPDQTVVIDGHRITSVGPSAALPVRAGAIVIDGSGKFLIPGLWDMHVHTLWEPAIDTLFPLFIANGVTGVRDMHTHFPLDQVRAWQKEVEDGRRVGPRFVFAGPILDGPKPFWPGSIPVGDAEAGRKAVRDLKSKGVDFIKVYTGLPRDAYFAIADEAKKQGLRFAGHVPTSLTALEASDAGQASIEHLSEELEACALSKSETRYDPAKGRLLFERFRANHTWQCPTLVIQDRLTFGREDRFTRDPRRRYLTPHIKAHADVDDSKRDWDTTQLYHDEQMKLMRAMAGSGGIQFLTGTDSPIGLMVPGFSLHDELAQLVSAGLTPAQALRAATSAPAKFLGVEKDLGAVEKGKLADLVLLDANPLADIRNTTRIRAVFADGQFYDRAALDGLLGAVERACVEAPGPPGVLKPPQQPASTGVPD
jgi:imidazolonepropionase-like amidohydrolase